jgi:Endoribonuclease L-PSP
LSPARAAGSVRRWRGPRNRSRAQERPAGRPLLAGIAAGPFAGASLADAVRVGVFLREPGNFPAMNEIYREFFAEPFPARTTVQSDLPGFEIEFDAVLFRER